MKKSPLLGAVGAYLVSLPLLWASGANAATFPWVGTADYTQASSSTGDEDIVGPFDEYDFANGVSLIEAISVANPGSFTIGDTFTGYYQSYLSLHQLNGVGVNADNLVVDGVSPGYEVTATATYNTEVTGVDGSGNATLSVTSGSFDVWFDTSPDYSFTGDSGFTGVDSLISGSISGGAGSFLPSFGVGFSNIDLVIGAFSYNQDVYNPDNIVAGSSIFTLKINASGTGPTAGVTSVLGHSVDEGDVLVEADGNMTLQAVPVPAAVWLFGSGLLGLVGIARRKKA